MTSPDQYQHYARQAALYAAEAKRSVGALVGIITGMLGDRHLGDDEIRFLHDWLTANDALRYTWPGDVIFGKVQAALADGVITEAERAHLVKVLLDLQGGTLETIATVVTTTTALAFDPVEDIAFAGAAFCLTGDFVYAPREVCERAILVRGGVVKTAVSKKLRYLVVGGLGSPAWKHGSFGTKIDKAMQLKREGAGVLIVDEPRWTTAVEHCPACAPADVR